MTDDQPIDYEGVARAVDGAREVVRALVAGLMDDGFTAEQARALTVWALAGRREDTDQ